MLYHPRDSGSAGELKEEAHEEAFIQYEQAIDSNLGGNNVHWACVNKGQKETLAGNS